MPELPHENEPEQAPAESVLSQSAVLSDVALHAAMTRRSTADASAFALVGAPLASAGGRKVGSGATRLGRRCLRSTGAIMRHLVNS
jgi:hypothetical protein